MLSWRLPALFALLLVPAPAPVAADDVVPGPVPARVLRVIDGDTIEVEALIWPGQHVRTLVRIDGIDAPEHRADCDHEGRLAARATARLVALAGPEARVDLTRVRFGKFAGRVVADVSVAGRNVADRLVADGLAMPMTGGRRFDWCGSAAATAGLDGGS